METALSYISQLPETREQQHTFANKIIEELMNGEHDLLKVWVQMSIIADTLNEIKESKTLKNAIVTELAKFGKGGTTVNNCKLTIGSRRTFDFSGCCHVDWERYKSAESDAKERLKGIETFLKAMQTPVADPETGELINPPTFTTTEFITVK